MIDSTEIVQHRLLVCTVGGSPEPIVTAILTSAPARIIFICSDGSEPTITAVLRELATRQSAIAEGAIDRRVVSDPQSLTTCVADMRRLAREVQRWYARSSAHAVLVDFTAGTKVMSAALALVAHRWPCSFSYIGGTSRDKGGVGIVLAGTERVLHSENPWDALAYQPIEDAVHLFNQRQPQAAAAVLDPFVKRPNLDPAIKRRITAVQHLARAYAAWDAFQHAAAGAAFDNTLKAANDLEAVFPEHALTATVEHHRKLCHRLEAVGGKPSLDLVLDLLANADRRAADGRYDDAVARLYRATEALAQIALNDTYQIDAAHCPIDRLPPAMAAVLADRTGTEFCKLALQNAYTLLRELGHPIGQQFHELQLDQPTSPLSTRNQSILAHGFSPSTERAYKALRSPVVQLASNPDLGPFAFVALRESR